VFIGWNARFYSTPVAGRSPFLVQVLKREFEHRSKLRKAGPCEFLVFGLFQTGSSLKEKNREVLNPWP
jgi:hypothetical protein